MTRLHTLAPLAALLLVACGGGGGGSSSTDTAPVAQQPEAEVEAERESEPDTSPQVAATIDGPLADLIGQVRIDHSFRGTSDLLSVHSAFAVSDLTDDEQYLYAPAKLTARLIDGELMSNPDADLICGHLEALDSIYCLAGAIDSSARLLFVFERPEDGFAFGDFEFCPPEQTTDACSRDIVTASDGGATLTIDGPAAAEPAAIEGDIEPYLAYFKQGAPTHDGTPLDAEDEARVRAIAERLEAMSER